MVCPACGASIVDGVRFCARCGTAVAASPLHQPQPPAYSSAPTPLAAHYAAPFTPRPRVQRNLQAVSVLWFVYAAYRVFEGLVGIFFLHAFTTHSFLPGFPFNHAVLASGPQWLAAVVPVIAAYTIVSVALSVIAGWSLLTRRSWGRTLAIIVAILSLLKFPFGTALGIYTLWVMAPAASALEWDAIADQG